MSEGGRRAAVVGISAIEYLVVARRAADLMCARVSKMSRAGKSVDALPASAQHGVWNFQIVKGFETLFLT